MNKNISRWDHPAHCSLSSVTMARDIFTGTVYASLILTLLERAFEIVFGLISRMFGQLSRICNQLKRRLSSVALVRTAHLEKEGAVKRISGVRWRPRDKPIRGRLPIAIGILCRQTAETSLVLITVMEIQLKDL